MAGSFKKNVDKRQKTLKARKHSGFQSFLWIKGSRLGILGP